MTLIALILYALFFPEARLNDVESTTPVQKDHLDDLIGDDEVIRTHRTMTGKEYKDLIRELRK